MLGCIHSVFLIYKNLKSTSGGNNVYQDQIIEYVKILRDETERIVYFYTSNQLWF